MSKPTPSTIRPQVSIRMNSAYRVAEGSGFVPMKATLDGRVLELRCGLLSAVKVDVDELRAALEMLEAAVPAASRGRADTTTTRTETESAL
jgi:hypothetical protein